MEVNFFFNPFKMLIHHFRTHVLKRLISFLVSLSQDIRVFIGVRKIGKESALVSETDTNKFCSGISTVNIASLKDLAKSCQFLSALHSATFVQTF